MYNAAATSDNETHRSIIWEKICNIWADKVNIENISIITMRLSTREKLEKFGKLVTTSDHY